MSPLAYLTVRKAKNKLVELLHKPFRLIVTFGFIVLLVMNFSLSDEVAGNRPLSEFKAIIFAFYILCFVAETKKGFQSGGTMFTGADVNLLFMSPIKSVTVLFHGMLGRFGSSLFIGIAFVYQFALLRSFYPIATADMLTAVIGYGAVVFISQIAGMLIYFYSCGEEDRIKKAKAVFYSVCMIFVLMFASDFIPSGKLTVSSAAISLTGFKMRFFPVAGWIFTAFDGAMNSDMLKVVLGVLPCVIFTAVSFVLLAFSKRGFYEDVLLSVEKSPDRKAEEGTRPVSNKKITYDSLKNGKGASVFFFKHILENKRTGTAVFSPSSLFYLVLIGIYGLVFESGFIVLFSLSCTVSVISVLSGRWMKELTKPYIYLIPEKPVKKLFFILPELLPKIIIESVLQCALIGFISHLGAVTVAAMIFTRTAFAFIFTSSALLVARLFREVEKTNVFAAVCTFVGMIFSLPSIIICIMLLRFGMGLIISFSVMAIVNTALSFVLLFLSRNLLKFSE